MSVRNEWTWVVLVNCRAVPNYLVAVLTYYNGNRQSLQLHNENDLNFSRSSSLSPQVVRQWMRTTTPSHSTLCVGLPGEACMSFFMTSMRLWTLDGPGITHFGCFRGTSEWHDQFIWEILPHWWVMFYLPYMLATGISHEKSPWWWEWRAR